MIYSNRRTQILDSRDSRSFEANELLRPASANSNDTLSVVKNAKDRIRRGMKAVFPMADWVGNIPELS